MKIRRKTNACLNCGHTLSEVYNFCPSCGQENNDNNVSIKTLASDFIANYFALDSKLIVSLKPFFFKPGYLTNRFIEGKRVTYFHPVRLYFFLSLLYFFTFSYVLNDTLEPDNIKANINQEALADLSPEEKAELDQMLEKIDSNANTELAQRLKNDSTPEQTAIAENGLIKWTNWAKDESLSNKAFMDSITSNGKNSIWPIDNELGAEKVRKALKDRNALKQQIFRNFSIMMFFMLPIFALILKLLYIRSSFKFIQHSVHTLHLHAFAYLIYSISLCLMLISVSDEIAGWIFFISFIGVSTYAYFSFLKVYKQGWLKTLIKFNLLGFIYINVLLVAVIFEFFVSLFLL